MNMPTTAQVIIDIAPRGEGGMVEIHATVMPPAALVWLIRKALAMAEKQGGKPDKVLLAEKEESLRRVLLN